MTGAGAAGEGRPSAERPRRLVSLCERCVHARAVESTRGSRFLLCGLARSDPRFAKYPPQPRMECPGYKE